MRKTKEQFEEERLVMETEEYLEKARKTLNDAGLSTEPGVTVRSRQDGSELLFLSCKGMEFGVSIKPGKPPCVEVRGNRKGRIILEKPGLDLQHCSEAIQMHKLKWGKGA